MSSTIPTEAQARRLKQLSETYQLFDSLTHDQIERVKVVTDSLKEVVQVNGFFISAGYGAYFGVWALFKDHLDPELMLWSVLSLITSVTLFAGWHMVGNLTMAGLVIGIPSSSLELGPQSTVLTRATRAGSFIMRTWLPVLIVISGFALVAVALMAYGVVRSLIVGTCVIPV